MLWLVYAVCQYIKATGDGEILFKEVPFLCADELACDEDERYFSPNTTSYTANILEHCKRAINRVKFGRDDLPLIGSCDWNDGFSEVGKAGEGTSVWLGEFLSVVADELSPMKSFDGPILVSYKDKAGKIDIIKNGIGGNTVQRALNRIGDFTGTLANGKSPDIIFMMFGLLFFVHCVICCTTVRICSIAF
jgi:hypothetical protein